ncbi:MAG TPA: glycosyltransferase family 4 protein [Vicinamibacterales bacterium]|nr:glycosyltransferase family 4 protein [Vicinamibacterales bacterium]
MRPLPAGGDLAGATWLIVAAGFHFRGGMDKANAELASYLLRRGARVHLVAHDVDPLFLEHPRARVDLVGRPLGSFALGEFGLDRRGRQAARALLASQPDARVVVNGGNCRWPGVNWVHYVHHAWTDVDADAPAWFKAKHRVFSTRWRRNERAALKAARVVIANSELTRTHLLTHVGVAAERVRTVYLGADASWGLATPDERAAARKWLGLPEARPAVAFVGALGLDRRKGFDTLWKAWTMLCSSPEWDADLIVAGSGADAKWIAAGAERAGIAQRVRMLGHSDRIKEVLAAVDLLVSPVRYEPYGLNVHEAICRGVPAVVSRNAGVAERYPADLADLLLHDPDSADELGNILRRWRPEMHAWKSRIAPLGRELRAYGWEDMAEAFVGTVAAA